MRIIVTAKEAMDRGVWMMLCEMKGLNPKCCNDSSPSKMEITLTEGEARRLRFLPEEDDLR